MDGQIFLRLLLLGVLLLFSAFFSAAETALMSINKIRVRYLAEHGNAKGKKVAKIVSQPNKLLSTILIGNNIVNIGASALATILAVELLGERIGLAIATTVMTLLVLIFGEIVPKSIAAHSSERVSYLVVQPISVLMKLFFPLTKLFSFLTNGVLKFLGYKNRKEPLITEEEILTLVNVGQEEGVLHVEEKEMIHSVLEFTDSLVKDVMVPRTDMFAVPSSLTLADFLYQLQEEQYSRIPVYEDTIDNILGVIYVKDLALAMESLDRQRQVAEFVHPAYFVPEVKKVGDLLREMKKHRFHLAIVVDEFGGTAGLVTLEDLVEEILGEIDDEYDYVENRIISVNENTTLIDGSVRLDELREETNINLCSSDADTLGGFVYSTLGKIPEEGEIFTLEGMEFKVAKMEGNRIKQVEILQK
ncbi:hemolysin family protein [Zhaonella formicivorans]|uniref:hemolysin family protein n=1 Tax=Zhaonella formicivorans TaxID=2528593 RepID=UPI0010E9242B|nr:hemolysin family protein [Zhaonella formicivorans]